MGNSELKNELSSLEKVFCFVVVILLFHITRNISMIAHVRILFFKLEEQIEIMQGLKKTVEWYLESESAY